MSRQRVLDFSEHNAENIDWLKVRNAGYWVILRIGIRGSMKSQPAYYGKIRMDFKFMRYIKSVKKYGIPYSIYFFPTSISDAEAKEEAAWIIRLIKELGIDPSMPVYLDSELVDGGKGRADGLSREKRTRYLKIICDALWDAGIPCGVYASTNWLINKLDMSQFDARTRKNTWCAQYAGECEYSGAYAMWQFTNRLQVVGVPGNGVDASKVVGEFVMNGEGYTQEESVAQEATDPDDGVKTNAGLLAYAKAQLGKPYWWGTFGQIATSALLTSKRKQYPAYYTASDFSKQIGQRVHDCVGLVKGYLWSDTPTSAPKYDSRQDVTAAGMYAKATRRGTISTLPEEPGICVFKGGSSKTIHHIGVYGADGYVYEAKGHAWGVVKTAYKASEWDYWAQCPFIHASGKTAPTAGSEGHTTQKEPAVDDAHTVRYYAVVATKKDPLNIRKGPGTQHAQCSFSPLPKGTKVGVCKHKSGRWCLIEYQGKYGYAYDSYLKKI